jgi:hypothetical protein
MLVIINNVFIRNLYLKYYSLCLYVLFILSAANRPVFGGTIQFSKPLSSFGKVPKTGHFLKNFYEFDGV